MAFINYLPFAAVVVLALFGFKIISTPMKMIWRLILNTAIGLLAIFIFNSAGRYIGVTIGLNLFSGIVVGLCGPAGIVILLIMRLLTF